MSRCSTGLHRTHTPSSPGLPLPRHLPRPLRRARRGRPRPGRDAGEQHCAREMVWERRPPPARRPSPGGGRRRRVGLAAVLLAGVLVAGGAGRPAARARDAGRSGVTVIGGDSGSAPSPSIIPSALQHCRAGQLRFAGVRCRHVILRAASESSRIVVPSFARAPNALTLCGCSSAPL